mgnify:CR=1 FL=1
MQLEDDIILAYNSADFFEFAAEASLYKTHIKMCTTSFRAKTFYSKPAGIFVKITILLFKKTNKISVPQCLCEKTKIQHS